jgi:hypothetical protein
MRGDERRGESGQGPGTTAARLQEQTGRESFQQSVRY